MSGGPEVTIFETSLLLPGRNTIATFISSGADTESTIAYLEPTKGRDNTGSTGSFTSTSSEDGVATSVAGRPGRPGRPGPGTEDLSSTLSDGSDTTLTLVSSETATFTFTASQTTTVTSTLSDGDGGGDAGTVTFTSSETETLTFTSSNVRILTVTSSTSQSSFVRWNSSAEVPTDLKTFSNGNTSGYKRPSEKTWDQESTVPIPTFLEPTGSVVIPSTAPMATFTTVPSQTTSIFTEVARTAALAEEACYQLPENSGSERAQLRNFQLRQKNASIPYPYIESINFENEGIIPLYLTVRDITGGSNQIDISNRSRVAIIDSRGNSMLLDSSGIYFATRSCKYDFSVVVKDIFKQLQKLTGIVCSAASRDKRLEDMDFRQVLFLKDQCGNPISSSLRKYPQLRIGESACNANSVDKYTGRWEFECTFPGSDSKTLQCQRAVKKDIVNFLSRHPFGGACPDLPTVITSLQATGEWLFSTDALRKELDSLELSPREKPLVEATLASYAQLWEILKQVFSKKRPESLGLTSTIEDYISLYNEYRDFEGDICESLHASEIPLKLGLTAGATTIDAITTLDWAPQRTSPYNVTVQDPSKIACCPDGSVSEEDAESGTCKYPDDALIGTTGCICGLTVEGQAVAFEKTECDNFVSPCYSDYDCSSAGYANFVCLTGTCCGTGVCIDPYACSARGIDLFGVQE